MQLSQNQTQFSLFFFFLFCISGVYVKFFEKKDELRVTLSWNYGLQKERFLNHPKSPASEH